MARHMLHHGGSFAGGLGWGNWYNQNVTNSSHQIIQYNWYDDVVMNNEKNLYIGASHDTSNYPHQPDRSTYPNSGMSGYGLSPPIVHEDCILKSATMSAAALAVKSCDPVVYPCSLAIGLVRNNYTFNKPMAGDTERTLLNVIYFSIPEPGVNRQVGVYNDLSVALMSGDGSGDGIYKLIDIGNEYKAGWYLGCVVLAPHLIEGVVKYRFSGSYYNWKSGIVYDSCIGAFYNIVVSIKLESQPSI